MSAAPIQNDAPAVLPPDDVAADPDSTLARSTSAAVGAPDVATTESMAPPSATAEPEPAESAPSASSADEAARRLQVAIAWRYAAPAFLLAPLVLVLYLFTDRIPVPSGDAPGPRAGELVGRLNPNTATWAELAMLPRVGETLARRIVAYREERLRTGAATSPPAGPVFRQLEDLDAVPGIGPKTLESIKPYLAFE